MDLKNVKVSVIIPTYRRSKFLVRAIDSVLNQTHENIEVVVVDDNHPNSEDMIETREILKKYAKDERVIYHKNQENLGCAMARNEGIELSTGEYITFLDDDDVYLPEKVEKQLVYMINNHLDMSFMDLSLFNENNHLVDYRSFAEIIDFSCNNLIRYHIMRHLTGTDTFMYKRDFIVGIGGFDDKNIGDEFYLMYKTIYNNAKIGYIDESYVKAYVHKGEGVSKGNAKVIGENELYSFKKRHFHLFSIRERMFIRFRHYVVLAITYKRESNFLSLAKYGLLAFLVSPIDFFSEPLKLARKVFNKRRYLSK